MSTEATIDMLIWMTIAASVLLVLLVGYCFYSFHVHWNKRTPIQFSEGMLKYIHDNNLYDSIEEKLSRRYSDKKVEIMMDEHIYKRKDK